MPPKGVAGKRRRKGGEEERPVKRSRTAVSHASHTSQAGEVLAVGQGDTGQLGLGEDVTERRRPGLVPLPAKAIQVVAGGMHAVALTEDGDIYTFGCNDEGALGRAGSEFEPHKVELNHKVVQVSAGDSHTAALTRDGRVFIWGTFRDANGKIGLLPDGSSSKEPVEVLADKTAVKVVSGADHLLCVLTDGKLFSFGNAEQGQLGRVQHCFCNRGGRKGKELLLGPSAVPFPRIRRKVAVVTDAWAGTYTSFAKTSDGRVYAWGLNNYCQLGIPDEENKFFPEQVEGCSPDKDWAMVSGGAHHTVALTADGTVYVMGRKEYGRLGLGEDGGDAKEPTAVTSLGPCSSIAAGEHVSFACTRDGRLMAWGMGTSNQLSGAEEGEDIHVPTAMMGKQLQDREGLFVDGGGQHSVLLVAPKAPDGEVPMST